jgi:4-carboxymuconolactone decarboxylase
MCDDALKKKTADTARLYFEGVPGERPYDLWKSFDPGLARDLSLFITGRMYAREVIPHPTRQLVTVAALAALGREEELRLHLHAALNVGVTGRELAETLFQTGVYAGVPAMNQALKALREVLTERNLWPLDITGC